ncbi:MAG: formate/nitrite transporter family protein [Alphaproteobacteria bacterium]|nr:formate/nitrite transporter family protein [Alphaproteobacteria bacterium]
MADERPDTQEEDNGTLRLPSSRIYKLIAKEGREELERPFQSLASSGLVAGLCISFSLFCEGFFKLHAPEGADFYLIENLGYTIGFLIVVMGRFQLFTENTITVILPLLEQSSWYRLVCIARLWTVVLAFNLIGTFLAALMVSHLPLFSPEQFEPFLEVSRHAVNRPLTDVFFQAMPAGFLIAAMVWMMPSAGQAKVWIVIAMTYLIAIGDFAHVVAGSIEAFLLMLNGEVGLEHGIGYLFMAAAGNIIGGTGVFAMMAYAQVKEEM